MAKFYNDDGSELVYKNALVFVAGLDIHFMINI